MNSAKYFRKDNAYNIYERLLPYTFDFQKQLSKDMLQNNWYETIHNENTRSMFSNLHIYRQLTTLFKSAALQKFCSQFILNLLSRKLQKPCLNTVF